MSREEKFKVTLGEYKGLPVKRPEVTVTDEELDSACRQQQRMFAQQIEVKDRAVKNGDIATIDFTGYCEGEAFEGGAGSNYPLEIGSGTFIPGFEEQIVGAALDGEIDVNVTFPDNYGAPNLAGKPALFKVKVNKIEELHVPELEAAVIEDIKKQLIQQKEQMAERDYENMLVDVIIKTSDVEIEQEMADLEVEVMLREWKHLMQRNGINPDQYYEMTGVDDEQMKQQLMGQAVLRLQSRLVLEAVAQVEGLEASEFEVESELDMLGKRYNLTREQVKAKMEEEHFNAMKADIRMRKAINLIKENVSKDIQ